MNFRELVEGDPFSTALDRAVAANFSSLGAAESAASRAAWRRYTPAEQADLSEYWQAVSENRIWDAQMGRAWDRKLVWSAARQRWVLESDEELEMRTSRLKWAGRVGGVEMDRRLDVSDLIERLKAATGPDREMDGTIWWTIYLTREQRKQEDRFGTVEQAIRHYGSAGNALEQFFDSSNPHCLARRAFQHPFTASIDAAVALAERVHPGAQVGLDPIFFEGDGNHRVEWDAVLCIPDWDRWNPVNSEWIKRIEARHADRCRAILLATLTALEAQP